jgi:hypothetical protein
MNRINIIQRMFISTSAGRRIDFSQFHQETEKAKDHVNLVNPVRKNSGIVYPVKLRSKFHGVKLFNWGGNVPHYIPNFYLKEDGR